MQFEALINSVSSNVAVGTNWFFLAIVWFYKPILLPGL